MEWKTVRLGDYISIKSGLAYKGCHIGKGENLLLGMGCVSFKEKFVESGARPYNDPSDDRFVVSPGDIVLATRQQSDNLPILAMPAIIPNIYQNKRVLFGTNLYKIENNSEIDNRFLFWLLKHQHYVNYIAGVKSGTAVQMVTKKNVENYKFSCPPKFIRDKISKTLWDYDRLIENNTLRIRLLEQMAENLYKEWFVRFRFPEHEKVEMVNGLPKGWERTKLTKNIKTSSGGTPSRNKGEYYKNGTIPWIKTGELQDCILINTEECITEDAVNNSSAKLFPKGTLLMAMYGVNVGKLGISEIEATCNQACCVFTPKQIDYKYYLFHYLKSIREYLLSVSFGAAQQNLSQELIKSIRVLFPDEKTNISFVKEVEPLFKEISIIQQQNQLLTRQRDLLLPRLMSGKLEIKS